MLKIKSLIFALSSSPHSEIFIARDIVAGSAIVILAMGAEKLVKCVIDKYLKLKNSLVF